MAKRCTGTLKMQLAFAWSKVDNLLQSGQRQRTQKLLHICQATLIGSDSLMLMSKVNSDGSMEATLLTLTGTKGSQIIGTVLKIASR